MTTAEMFSEISAHMIKGLMFHSQMADYYTFLGLGGYADCHEKQYKCESKKWRKLSRYYITRHNRLIIEKKIEDPKAIPDGWRQYKRQDVDANTRKKAVQNGLKAWHSWEEDTKDLYVTMYRECVQSGDISDLPMIQSLIDEVENELVRIESYEIELGSSDYSMDAILKMQH